jgi:hypothetical protein
VSKLTTLSCLLFDNPLRFIKKLGPPFKICVDSVVTIRFSVLRVVGKTGIIRIL